MQPDRPPPVRRRSAAWPEQLAAFIASRRDVPFGWGTQDCVTFAYDAVLALTGIDPGLDRRGSYATEDQAAAILVTEGGLEASVSARMEAAGMQECQPAKAQRGDVALVLIRNELVVGVITGVSVAAPGVDGLAFVPRRLIQRAWAI